MTTDEENRQRLTTQEKLEPESEAFKARLEELTRLRQEYEQYRLYPEMPDWEIMCFYPMNKRREASDNWYSLDFAARKKLMAGHARVGRKFSGRISQLITGSTGLDDWEWGVTLMAHQLDAVKEIVYVPAETATDVPDASAALMSRDIDAVLQIPGNLTASAFGSISEAARRSHIPVFAFQKSQAIGGAMVVVARDYRDSGRHAAHLAARIMRGENPAKIPLEDFGKTSLIVNLDAARALNISLPPALVRSAKDVIGATGGNR